MNDSSTHPSRRDVGIQAVLARFPAQASRSADVLQQHSHDESHHRGPLPDLVVFPTSTEEVAHCVSICHEHGLPVIPFGVGTALEGHVVPLLGGVSLDLSRMDRVLRLSPDDLDCTVEAGITRRALAAHLTPHGLFFPVDPGADATIGGMTATGASGTTTVLYGAMRDLVLSLRVVLSDGRIVTTARRARKSSAGYDLTSMFIGSEGTLGVITEVTLRLSGQPEAICSATVRFTDLRAAVQAVSTIIQLGVGVARIELLDDAAVAAVSAYSNLQLGDDHMLLLEFHGSQASIADDENIAKGVLTEFGGTQWQSTTDQAERSRLWRARHDAAWAIRAQRAGSHLFVTDVCVPISVLAETVEATRADLRANDIYGPIVGHVGDGNFHVVLPVADDDPRTMEPIISFNERLIKRALDAGGTCTGEHGVGMGKMSYLARELGDDAVALMRTLKRAIDPTNIMNPGKIVDLS